MRSFDEPPGFWPSSLAKILHVGVRRQRVDPDERRVADEAEDVLVAHDAAEPRPAQPPATAGRIEIDVAVGDLGVELVEVPDVVVVAVHVHELVQPALVVDQLALDRPGYRR